MGRSCDLECVTAEANGGREGDCGSVGDGPRSLHIPVRRSHIHSHFHRCQRG